MQNNFISDKTFEDIRTIYSASKPIEIYMGSDTKNAIDTFFNTILERIQQAIETSNERESRFTHESVALLYYSFQKIVRLIRLKKKDLKKLLKFKRVDTDFSSHQRCQEEFEQNDTSIALNILFVPHNSEEIKFAYKSNYNERKN